MKNTQNKINNRLICNRKIRKREDTAMESFQNET